MTEKKLYLLLILTPKVIITDLSFEEKLAIG